MTIRRRTGSSSSRPQSGAMPRLCRSVRLLTVAICLGFAQPLAALAQTTAPAALPPAAQEALNKGIIAAKVPDYLLAIRYFEEARKLAPTAPLVVLNLGLAESKIPGRELRAIASFGAYLAAFPDAPNAAAVREQMDALDVKSQSNLSHLIKVAQDAAGQIPENTQGTDIVKCRGRDNRYIFAEWRDTQRMLYEVSLLWASSGDTARAQETAGLIKAANWKGHALREVALAQITAGDTAGASLTAARIRDKDDRSTVQNAIVGAGAKTKPRSQVVVGVSDWLKISGASGSQGSLLNTAPFPDLAGYLKSLPPPSDCLYVYFWALQETVAKVVKAQNVIGQMLKPRATPALLMNLGTTESKIPGRELRAIAWFGAYLAASPDAPNAAAVRDQIYALNVTNQSSVLRFLKAVKAAAELIRDPKLNLSYRDKSARVQGWIDAAQAKATAAPNSNPQPTSNTNQPIEPAIKVSDWLDMLDDDNKYDNCPLNTVLFLDQAGYLKSLPSSDDPGIVFSNLYDAAEKIVTAKDQIDKMLKRQAIQ
jgi:hypothetical protein